VFDDVDELLWAVFDRIVASNFGNALDHTHKKRDPSGLEIEITSLVLDKISSTNPVEALYDGRFVLSLGLHTTLDCGLAWLDTDWWSPPQENTPCPVPRKYRRRHCRIWPY